MAAETELERLVVRLVGDAKQYENTLKTAAKNTEKYTRDVQGRLRDAQGKFVMGHKKMAFELSQTTSLMKKAGIIAVAYGEKLRTIGSSVRSVGRSLTFRLTLPIVALGAAAIKVGADFDSGFAGVRKTVNATEAELADLRKEFKLLLGVIPTDATELLGIGEIAGQLGIATGNIASFTKTIAQLGAATNLTTEEAATSMAKFANVIGLSEDKFSNMGSALVALGNSVDIVNGKLATSEREIMAMASRLVGAGNTIGLTTSKVLGLAATLSALDIRAEAGGTAFSKLMLDIQTAVAVGGEELTNFATVAGTSATEFRKSFRKDAMGAILDLLHGLESLSKESRIIALRKIGVEGTRMTGALLKVIPAVKLLEDALTSSEKAFRENTALAKEAEQRFRTFWSQVKLLRNQFKLLLGEAFDRAEPMIRKLVAATKEATVWFRNLSPATKDTVVVILAITAAIGPLLVGLGTLITMIGVALPAALVASKVGLIALAVGGFAVLLKWIHDSNPEMIEFNKQLERSRDLTKQMSALRGKQFESVFAEATGITDKGKRKEFLTGELRRALKDQGALAQQYAQGLKKVRSETRLGGGFGTGFLQTAELTVQKDRVKEIEQSLKLQRGFVKRLKSEIAEAGKPAVTGAGVRQFGLGERAGEFIGSLKRRIGILKEKHAIDAYAKSLDRQMDAVRRGRAITLQYMTPLERFVKKQLELRILFKNNKISVDDFNRGIKDITKSLEDAQKKSKIKIDFTVTGLDVIREGSVAAAALSRTLELAVAGAGPPQAQPPAVKRLGPSRRSLGPSFDRLRHEALVKGRMMAGTGGMAPGVRSDGVVGPSKPGETGRDIGKSLGEGFKEVMAESTEEVKSVLAEVLKAAFTQAGLN